MKRLSIALVLILLVGVGAQGVLAAQPAACRGLVIGKPIYGDNPVWSYPNWLVGRDTGFRVFPGQIVQVTGTHYRPSTGEIWFNISIGWIQAYSGYTTGRPWAAILADSTCAIPHSVGD